MFRVSVISSFWCLNIFHFRNSNSSQVLIWKWKNDFFLVEGVVYTWAKGVRICSMKALRPRDKNRARENLRDNTILAYGLSFWLRRAHTALFVGCGFFCLVPGPSSCCLTTFSGVTSSSYSLRDWECYCGERTSMDLEPWKPGVNSRSATCSLCYHELLT